MEVLVKRHHGFLLLLILASSFYLPTLPAQEPDPVVRLSFVQGKVEVFRGDAAQFDQAVTNMPLTTANRLQTGDDGQAEIEFDDGSVARLTPNSSLRLVRLPSGGVDNGSTEMEQVSGLVYFE